MKASTPLPFEFYQKLPKVDLHCHLDGSVRPSTILALAAEQGVSLPASTEPELERLLYAGASCTSLVDYLRAFDVINSVLQCASALSRVSEELLEDCALENVRYLEVRFCPLLHVRRGLSAASALAAVCIGVVSASSRLPLSARVLVCGMRHHGAFETLRLLTSVSVFRECVVGVDLAGPEIGFPASRHAEALREALARRSHVTLHAGEASGADSVREALGLGARRLGHGVRSFEDPAVLARVVDLRVPLEVCVTSNRQTRALGDAEHPARRLAEAGAILVPCTDNRTVSRVSMSSEMRVWREELGFEKRGELRALLRNAAGAAFLPEMQRRALSRTLLAEFEAVCDDFGLPREGIPAPIAAPALREEFWYKKGEKPKKPKCDLDFRLETRGPVTLDAVSAHVRTLHAELVARGVVYAEWTVRPASLLARGDPSIFPKSPLSSLSSSEEEEEESWGNPLSSARLDAEARMLTAVVAALCDVDWAASRPRLLLHIDGDVDSDSERTERLWAALRAAAKAHDGVCAGLRLGGRLGRLGGLVAALRGAPEFYCVVDVDETHPEEDAFHWLEEQKKEKEQKKEEKEEKMKKEGEGGGEEEEGDETHERSLDGLDDEPRALSPQLLSALFDVGAARLGGIPRAAADVRFLAARKVPAEAPPETPTKVENAAKAAGLRVAATSKGNEKGAGERGGDAAETMRAAFLPHQEREELIQKFFS